MSIEKIYDYFRSYDKETYQVFACGDDTPSEQDIEAFESEFDLSCGGFQRVYDVSAWWSIHGSKRRNLAYGTGV